MSNNNNDDDDDVDSVVDDDSIADDVKKPNPNHTIPFIVFINSDTLFAAISNAL